MKKILFTTAVWVVFTPFIYAQFVRDYNEETQKRGISNYEGTVLVPAEYDEIQPYYIESDTFFLAKKGNRMGVFDVKGRLTIPFDYEEVGLWATQSHMQFGYALVTKERRTNVWGVLDVRTGAVVLPLKFEFVRAIFPDLLVGRVFADSTLQFFDAQAKPLFQAYGRSVKPGFDDQSISIIRVDRSEYFADKRGKPIFPPNLKRPQWTDGKRVICIEDGKYGLVTMAGKQLVPFVWADMKPMNQGQFRVKNQMNQEGLIDANGQFIIPLDGGHLHFPYGKTSPFYVRSGTGSDPDYPNILYDATGKLLFSDGRMASINLAGEYSEGKFVRRGDYFDLSLKSAKKEHYIFHHQRGQILPESWSAISYFSEKHPLIATRRDEAKQTVVYNAFDLNGKLLFAAPADMALYHTQNPRLLLAAIENRNRFALLDLDGTPEKTVFEYTSLRELPNGHFIFGQNDMYGLLNPKGKVLVPANKYNSISATSSNDSNRFRENKSTRGRLIAWGRYEGLDNLSQAGINERGEGFVIGPEPTRIPPAQPVEKFVSSDKVIEITEIPEGVMETMPNQPAKAPEAAVQHTGAKENLPVLQDVSNASPSDDVVEDPQKQPQFPGGGDALLRYLDQNKKYPAVAIEKEFEGRVIVSFIVEKDGTLTDVQIIKDIGGGCGAEALRLVRQMPNWVPGQDRGKVVRAKYTLPVNFKLK